MFARKILNSRKESTIEVNYKGSNGSAPSGKSKGKHEVKDYNKSLDEEINSLNKLQESIEKLNIKEFSDLKKFKI